MKKIALLLLGFVLVGTLSAQDLISNFQKKHEKEAEFSIVNITPKMFEMISMMSDDNDDEAGFIKNLTGLKLISSKKTPDKYFQDATKMLLASDHEELMSVIDKEDNIHMYVKEKKKGVISSLIIAIAEPAEFTLIGITGDIDLKQISKLSKTLNIEHLEKVDSIK